MLLPGLTFYSEQDFRPAEGAASKTAPFAEHARITSHVRFLDRKLQHIIELTQEHGRVLQAQVERTPIHAKVMREKIASGRQAIARLPKTIAALCPAVHTELNRSDSGGSIFASSGDDHAC